MQGRERRVTKVAREREREATAGERCVTVQLTPAGHALGDQRRPAPCSVRPRVHACFSQPCSHVPRVRCVFSRTARSTGFLTSPASLTPLLSLHGSRSTLLFLAILAAGRSGRQASYDCFCLLCTGRTGQQHRAVAHFFSSSFAAVSEF